MPVKVRCRNGHEWMDTTTTFSGDIRIEDSDAASVFVFHCPTCGALASPLPPGRAHGFYRVGPDGEMRLVRALTEHLGRLDRATLDGIRQEAAAAAATHDESAAEALLERTGLRAVLSAQKNRMELWALIPILISIISLVLMIKEMGQPELTPEQVETVCVQVSKTVKTDPDGQVTVHTERVVETHVGRNDRCPCGSGAKYKRCHGRHPTDPQHPDNLERGAGSD